MLFVEIVGGPDVATLAEQLRGLDTARHMHVTAAQSPPLRPAAVGLVIGTPQTISSRSPSELAEVADIILGAGHALDEQLRDLHALRISVFAAGLAGRPSINSAPVLQTYDRNWAAAAGRYVGRLKVALSSCGARGGATFAHIGSTAVPGLSAKPIVDLQIQVPALRRDAQFDAALHRVGFVPAEGSRPDSPGVYRDLPRGSDDVADDVWDKRLFIRPDPGQPAVLHIRKAQSPWARYTVQFRDWLRRHPTERVRYQEIKSELAIAHSGDGDFDDYTRAKTAYFDAVQESFERNLSAPE